MTDKALETRLLFLYSPMGEHIPAVPYFSKKLDFMRLTSFDYCLQIMSDQGNKTPQKQPELSCSHLGPCYRLIPPLCRAQRAASCSAAAAELGKVPALPVRNSKLPSWHLPQSAGSKLSSSLCSSLHSQKGTAEFASLTRFKSISSLLLENKNPQFCSHSDILSKQVFCCCLF